MSYHISDAVFVGDTMFMPDFGTARADFPGGDARMLYRSIKRILSLPAETRLFMCHDYKAPGRDQYAWETTVGEERAASRKTSSSRCARRVMRRLPRPCCYLLSIQVNMRAGMLPSAEANGVRYLKVPVDLVA